MATPKTERERYVRQLTLVERYGAVLYPIDLPALLDRLPDEGWIVPDRLPRGERDDSSITPPVKGNVHLRIDQGNKLIGVSGEELSETLAVYRELRSLVRDFADASVNETHYVELRYIGAIKANVAVDEAFQRWWSSENGKITRLGSQLAQRLPSDSNTLAPYGLRFASAGVSANRPNWAELTVGPVIVGPSVSYHFDLIFRNRDSAVTESVAEHANEIIDETIMEIERA